jgi:hypothetical protein
VIPNVTAVLSDGSVVEDFVSDQPLLFWQANPSLTNEAQIEINTFVQQRGIRPAWGTEQDSN